MEATIIDYYKNRPNCKDPVKAANDIVSFTMGLVRELLPNISSEKLKTISQELVFDIARTELAQEMQRSRPLQKRRRRHSYSHQNRKRQRMNDRYEEINLVQETEIRNPLATNPNGQAKVFRIPKARNRDAYNRNMERKSIL